MLHLPTATRDAVVAHARADHPDECCGVLAGIVDGANAYVTRAIPMTNAERSPTWFSFDPIEQLHVWREIEQNGENPNEEVLAIYHSHTMTEARPSPTDLQYAQALGDVIWLLVSTRSVQDEVLAWRIAEGQALAEEIRLV